MIKPVNHWPIIKLRHLQIITMGAREILHAVRGEFPIEEVGDKITPREMAVVEALDAVRGHMFDIARWFQDTIDREERKAGGKLESHP